jgi:flagellar hook assembly protein FlgD
MMVSAPSNEVTVIIGESSNDEDVAQVIHSITASPNPFNSVTSFAIRGKANDQVSINIFNIKGQIVKSLSTNLDQNGNAGLNWNAIDNAGNNLPMVSISTRMTSSEKQFSGRLILAR